MEKETIKWMTRKGKYKASFRDFAVACCLNYNVMKNGEQMNALPKVMEEACGGYTPEYHKMVHRPHHRRWPSPQDEDVRRTALVSVHRKAYCNGTK
jgi:hypothetical protein